MKDSILPDWYKGHPWNYGLYDEERVKKMHDILVESRKVSSKHCLVTIRNLDPHTCPAYLDCTKCRYWIDNDEKR